VFYCPVCGEQIKFEDTAVGEVKTCPKCNAHLKLTIEEGKFKLEEVEDKE
jgi:Zn-finger nucleic acid-binding protein